MSDYARTPLLEFPLGKRTFFLKMECWQPTGSFKIRGMSRISRYFKSQGKVALVSSSGGNAGYSVAYAGRKLGLPVTVVVPASTPEAVRQRITRLGAEVIVKGSVWDEAHEHALALADRLGGAYIHPFDHPEIWAGHATLIEECAEEMPEPDAVVVAVGGGGLLVGVLEGMHQVGWLRAEVLAAETEGAASYAAALRAGRPVDIGTISSVAKSLGARKVADAAFQWSLRHAIRSWVISDEEALAACRRFPDEQRTLVEPACGAALSAMYRAQDALPTAEKVLVVVCGGINV